MALRGPGNTFHGYERSEVTSAAQKCVRLGLDEEAIFWMTEKMLSGEKTPLVTLMRTVALEDVGPADWPAVKGALVAAEVLLNAAETCPPRTLLRDCTLPELVAATGAYRRLALSRGRSRIWANLNAVASSASRPTDLGRGALCDTLGPALWRALALCDIPLATAIALKLHDLGSLSTEGAAPGIDRIIGAAAPESHISKIGRKAWRKIPVVGAFEQIGLAAEVEQLAELALLLGIVATGHGSTRLATVAAVWLVCGGELRGAEGDADPGDDYDRLFRGLGRRYPMRDDWVDKHTARGKGISTVNLAGGVPDWREKNSHGVGKKRGLLHFWDRGLLVREDATGPPDQWDDRAKALYFVAEREFGVRGAKSKHMATRSMKNWEA